MFFFSSSNHVIVEHAQKNHQKKILLRKPCKKIRVSNRENIWHIQGILKLRTCYFSVLSSRSTRQQTTNHHHHQFFFLVFLRFHLPTYIRLSATTYTTFVPFFRGKKVLLHLKTAIKHQPYYRPHQNATCFLYMVFVNFNVNLKGTLLLLSKFLPV